MKRSVLRSGALRTLATAWCCALATAIAAPASAEPQTCNAATAQALFDEARKLMDADRPLEACPKLEESQHCDPGMGTLFNLSVCYERTARTASAWSGFLEAAALAHASGRTDKEKAYRAKAAELEPRLARVLISVRRAVPGLVVTRNGVTVGVGSLGTAIPVDPGKVVIEAVAPGHQSFRKEVVAAPEASVAVEVPALAIDLGAPSPRNASKPTPDFPTPHRASGGAMRTTGIVLGITGIASAALGAGFGAASMVKKGESDATCAGDACRPPGFATRHEAVVAGNVSTVAFGIAAVTFAGGAVIYLLSSPSSARGNPPSARRGAPLAWRW